MRFRSTALLALLAALVAAGNASAAAGPAPGVQRLNFSYGPIVIRPGTNLINIGDKPVPKPAVDGYITRLRPNLTLADGRTIPPTDRIHLHHGVWLNAGSRQYPRSDVTEPGLPERFFASGEEKTVFRVPAPYGYFVRASDTWILNYMIHDLTNRGAKVIVKYQMDFVPADSALGRSMKPAKPVWMDVENGSAYPVFDVLKGSGRHGQFTFPNQAANAYSGAPRNTWTVPRDTTLLGTAGHMHPGGLYDDLRLDRPGAGSRLLFRSQAHYFGNRPPVSWDMAMTQTPPGWRVRLHQGDTLRVSATYDTSRSSWYESMGIMIAFVADDAPGVNAFATRIATRGKITHGHLAENNHRGGTRATGVVDPTKLPDGSAPGGIVPIGGFRYHFGDLHDAGASAYPPVVAVGQSLTFENKDVNSNVFHSVTSCRAPCNLATGTSFPTANGPVNFDSGQLGFGPPGFTAAANRDSWHTPANLTPGTYTYFCRVHPFMRGAFRVVRP
ncbi:MAG TPA: hypothetical protein VIM22_04965 [Solirubrobacteraceae bacterium]|jgi:plastocyanin